MQQITRMSREALALSRQLSVLADAVHSEQHGQAREHAARVHLTCESLLEQASELWDHLSESELPAAEPNPTVGGGEAVSTSEKEA
jgi:hypothetical protein